MIKPSVQAQFGAIRGSESLDRVRLQLHFRTGDIKAEVWDGRQEREHQAEKTLGKLSCLPIWARWEGEEEITTQKEVDPGPQDWPP